MAGMLSFIEVRREEVFTIQGTQWGVVREPAPKTYVVIGMTTSGEYPDHILPLLDTALIDASLDPLRAYATIKCRRV
jgi:hypothetical protein